MKREYKIDFIQIIQLLCWKYLKFTRPSFLQVDGKIIFNKFTIINIKGQSSIHVLGDLDLCSASLDLENSKIISGKLVIDNAYLKLSNSQIHLGDFAHIKNSTLLLSQTTIQAKENFRLHSVNINASNTRFNVEAYFFGQSTMYNTINWNLQNAYFSAGKNCRLQSDIYQLQSKLNIGNNTFINTGTKISCLEQICIGDYVMISYDCLIFDNNSHQTDFNERRLEIDRGFPNGTVLDHKKKPFSAPILIENDVWIGVRCIILKGVTMGQKSIAAANTVVLKNVGELEMVYNNPNRYKAIVSQHD
jgi:acetyltransferase-like isoleucine patch superfamily enzyme